MPDGSRSFKDDITNWDVQRVAFKKWADEMLPGILDVSCAPDSVLTSFPAVHSVPERKAPDAACPTIAYTADGSPLLPHIDLNGISPQVTVSILQAFMIAAWSKYSCSFQFRWH